MTTLSPELWLRLSQALGHTLLHSLWQGSLAALGLAVCLNAIRKSNANARYLVASLAIFALPLWMAATFAAEWNRDADRLDSSNSPVARLAISTMPATADPTPGSAPKTLAQIPWHAIAATGWAIGAAFFLLRLAAGWRGLGGLRRSSVPVADPDIRRLFAGVCDRLAVRERVALLSSDRLSGPVMIGFLWPAIILPSGLLNGIPAAHLQSILAHELAHFRRWDYLVNLGQSIVEALLFYHPAAWWIARQIRVEREHACDDLAATLPGSNPSRYAGALAWLEENRSRCALPESALAIMRDRRDTLSRIGRLRAIFAQSKTAPQQGSVVRSTGLVWICAAAFGLTIASASPENFGSQWRTTTIRSERKSPENSVVSQCQQSRQRVEKSLRLLNEEVIWREHSHKGIRIPLFNSVVILERGGRLYNLYQEETRLFEEFPNQYLLENKLNLLDGGLPARDPDGDGFTNLEEYQAKTDPNEAKSHPDYAGKLRFIARHAQVYRITFAAQPDNTRFQLNRQPSARWARKTMILRLGEITADGQLRLDDADDDTLEVTFLATVARHRLPKKKPVEIPTWFAELQLALPGELPFIVESGESFRLKREPGRVLRLIAIGESEVEVIDPQAGDRWKIGLSAEPSD